MKFCNYCKEYKDEKLFAKNKNTKDGLQYMCKICQKSYQQNNKEKIKKYQKEYQENNKEKMKKYQKEYRNIINPDYQKEWIAKNPSYHKNYRKKWKKINPNYYKNYFKNKLMKNEKFHTIFKLRILVNIKHKTELIKRDKSRCILCNKLLKKRIIIHHILPVKSHPNLIDDVNNLVCLCYSCHINIAHKGCFKDLDLSIVTKLQNYILSL